MENQFYPILPADRLPFNLPVRLLLRYEIINEGTYVLDIDGDGRTDLAEAIHALEIVSGSVCE